ncbi:MAG: glycoside hydrolase domain-containing protein [Thermoguttaceae bacterium]
MILRSIVLCYVTFCTTLVADDVASWELTGCAGKRIVDRTGDVFEVTGTGQDSGGWYSQEYVVGRELQPRGWYRFSFEACSPSGGGGCAPCGFENFARDFHAITPVWQPFSYVARVPDNCRQTRLRLCQWEAAQTYQFKNPRVQQVVPLTRRIASRDAKSSIVLGDGEMIVGGVYTFTGDMSGEGSYAHRPLETMRCGFNTNRFTFGSDNEVVYNFSIPATPFKSATWEMSCCHYVSGACIVEASRDGETWTELGSLGKVGSLNVTLPDSLFPAESLKVRLRTGSGASLQIDNTRFEAVLENANFEGVGETVWGDVIPKGTAAGFFDATDAAIAAKLVFDETRCTQDAPRRINFPRHRVEYKVPFSPYHNTEFVYQLPSSKWFGWCEADWKVSPNPMVAGYAAPIEIAAAKNDVESFQLVLLPHIPCVRTLTATLEGDIEHQDGTATIPSNNVAFRYAYYHFVHRKTDTAGVVGYVPDALPPLDSPLEITPNRHQPIWVTVTVPPDAVAGDYHGTVKLTVTNDSEMDGVIKVPFIVRVWNFALPRTNTLDTAYGMNPWMIFKYHNAKTEAEQRAVLDLYFENFAAHRISPYNLAPLDPYTVEWLPNADPPQCRIDFTRFDAAMERAFERFGFTQFRLDVYGLGGGTFHERDEPSLVGFGLDTPQYQAMLHDYLTKLQAHLEEKGWLDNAYVYWFDEPDPKDYEFVARSLKLLQTHAPKLRRMMTEEPNAAFVKTLQDFGTSIDIWCPVSENYNDASARERMAAGEKFWWYVCTGPKSPYCTLFIDHAATALRAWHWQAWERGIGGTLVWESTYWTSDAAFPDAPQNPYLDPMGYVSGYSTPRGTKLFWGNGDGRFVYPPLEAAVPGMNDGKFVLKPPVSSIRWEMIREGVEDYEMLSLLRNWYNANAASLTPEQKTQCETLLTVPSEITTSMTEWTKHAEPIHKQRRAIGEFLDRISR